MSSPSIAFYTQLKVSFIQCLNDTKDNIHQLTHQSYKHMTKSQFTFDT